LISRNRDVEVLNMLDDHSRLLISSRAFKTTKAVNVVESFHEAAARYGLPASVLTDNGGIFTAEARNGRCVMESELLALSIAYKHSRPYHPQTCGKVERFHQTLKKYLASQKRAGSVEELQMQLDTFAEYYNNVRPHRAVGRRTPAHAFSARAKATPVKEGLKVPPHCRVRRDRVDKAGKVTLRYRSKLLHIGVGRAHAGKRILLLVADRHVRIVNEDGGLMCELVLDPKRIYQPQARTEDSSGMSRDSRPRCLATRHWWATDKTPSTRVWAVLLPGQLPRCCLRVPT
jgi:hypothetical protein